MSSAHQATAQSKPPLTQEEAEHRSSQIGSVEYQLHFKLDSTNERFSGLTTIKFLAPKTTFGKGSAPFLDFDEGSIQKAQINGVEVQLPYDGSRIQIPWKAIQEGSNEVKIQFDRAYTKTGNGLHRFVDPEDKQVYLRSDLEPYYAHLIFPCFDQPDLKAQYILTAETPKGWELISNTSVTSKKVTKGSLNWTFEKSAPMATYVFALIGGPYTSWSSKAGKIPLKLYARKSLKKYVNAQEWFKVTQLGLDFFAKTFKYPYPFGKYDQILVPDFNWGAMENIGAVTFSERFAYRSKITEEMRIDRADVILHEMAHMWFGNLVTMKWWNDLWLNESFATFAAAWALDTIGGKLKMRDTWQNFFVDMKQWAYAEDQQVTSHPIEGEVVSTDEAFTMFDGITYGKGASTLKQIFYVLGEKAFAKGLQTYFKTFAYRNATLKDFISHLAAGAKTDLSDWQKEWLQTLGTNTVQAEVACNAKGIESLTLIQDRAQQPKGKSIPNRKHSTQVALFYKNKKGLLEPKYLQSVRYEGSRTQVKGFEGRPCPALIMPNFEDYDFAKMRLDAQSLATLESDLSAVTDPLTRQMLWFSLWEMVYDGEYPAQKYIELALRHLPKETNPPIVRKVLGTLAKASTSQTSALWLLPNEETTETYRSKLEDFFLKGAQKAPGGSDIQLLWYQSFLSVAKKKESLALLLKWLGSPSAMKGLKIDQERRWEMLRALARNGFARAVALLEKEKKRDRSDHGEKMAISVEVQLPDPKIKSKWKALLTEEASHPTDKSLPDSKLIVAIQSMHTFAQEALTRSLEDSYFEFLPILDKKRDRHFVSAFAWFYLPRSCDDRLIGRLKDLLKDHRDLTATSKKSLETQIQDLERCQKARALSLQWQKDEGSIVN